MPGDSILWWLNGEGLTLTSAVRIIFAVVILCIIVPGLADFTVQWGTSDQDVGQGVATDSKNDVYVAGYTRGSLDGNTNAGSTDIFLTKLFPNGTKHWTRQWGTNLVDNGKDVDTDSNNNACVTGYTQGSLDGNTNAGSTDIFLTKFFPNGTKHWTRQWGTSSWDQGQGVAIDSNNDVYATGRTAGALDGNTNAGSSDIFLTKYSSDGTKQWTRQWGTSGFDDGKGVATDSNNNAYVCGSVKGSLDGNTWAGNDDIFLTKYSSDGTKQWTRQWGTNGNDQGYGVATDSNNDVYVAGTAQGAFDGTTNAGQDDIFLTKFFQNGTKQWTRQWGTINPDRGFGVATFSNTSAFVTGITSGNLDGSITFGNDDIFLTKYSSDGTKQWTRQWGVNSPDSGLAVATNYFGLALVTGFTYGAIPASVTSAGNQDIFLSSVSENITCSAGTTKGNLFALPDLSENGQTCPQCALGKFSNTSNAPECTQCPNSATNFFKGSTDCNETISVVTSIEPQLGPSVGNTAVTFIGGNLNSTDRPVFQSGNTKIAAPSCTWQSSTKINCTTPAFPFNANVSVFIESATTNPFYVAPTFSYFSTNYTGMEPDSGPVTGGTTVVIQTEYVSIRQPSKVKCRFGSANPVTATSMTSLSVTCVTPNLGTTGAKQVYLTMNDQQYDLVQGGLFLAYSSTLTSMSPQSGPKAGGTVITLSGTGFVVGNDASSVWINPQFGSHKVVNAVLVGSTFVAKTIAFSDVPSLAGGSIVSCTVYVSPNGAQYLGSTTTFNLYEDHGISSASPSTAPTAKSGITISLSPESAKSFTNTSSEIRVRFRPSDGSINTVQGTFVSSSLVTAAIPSMSAVGRGDVSVALNGQQWSAWTELTLFRVDSITPQWGPTSGDTPVTVTGAGFNNTGANLKCQFGSTTPVVATYVTSTRVTCTSPLLTSGHQVVSVTTNGNDYSTTTRSAVTLTAYTPPVLSGVFPSRIPAGNVPTVMSIAGSGFVNTGLIRVRFVSSEVNVTFVTATRITFTTPSQTAGSYPVTVSLNGGLQYSGNNVSFTASNPAVTSVFPVGGPQIGSTQLTIAGSGFVNTNVSGSMVVRLAGSQVLNVNSGSETHIILSTPTLNVDLASSSSTKDVTVEVTTNAGGTWVTNNQVKFTAYDHSSSNFNGTSPTHSIVTGGTVVQLTGTIPVVGMTASIRLLDGNGWSSSITASRTQDHVQFTTPQYHGTASFPVQLGVELALNGQQFFGTQQTVTVYNPPSITAVNPTQQISDQNLIVTITGTGFIDTGSVFVRLGNLSTLFTPLLISETSITFRAQYEVGQYRLLLSLDGGQHFSISPVAVTYEIMQKKTSVTVSGGSRVHMEMWTVLSLLMVVWMATLL